MDTDKAKKVEEDDEEDKATYYADNYYDSIKPL